MLSKRPAEKLCLIFITLRGIRNTQSLCMQMPNMGTLSIMEPDNDAEGKLSKKRNWMCDVPKESVTNTFSVVNQDPLFLESGDPMRAHNADIVSVKKKKKNAKLLDDFDICATDGDCTWLDTLSDSQLDLLVNIKQLMLERIVSTGVKCSEVLFPSRIIRAVGMVLEDLIKDRMENLLSSLHGRDHVKKNESVADDACVEDN
eukprot:c27307_g2_i1 orf=901-1506(+)